MNIDRRVPQGSSDKTRQRVKFVLDLIEQWEKDFSEVSDLKWGTRLTYEEIIGALVSAEQELERNLEEII